MKDLVRSLGLGSGQKPRIVLPILPRLGLDFGGWMRDPAGGKAFDGLDSH